MKRILSFKQIQDSDIKEKKKWLYNKIKPYYFLDTIQQTFFKTGLTKKSGSLSLSEKIYEKLMPLLNDNYQFMHQKAKCLLRKSRIFKKDKVNDKKRCLNAALQQINRAIGLADKANSKNVEHSIFHMRVTKVLILVNEWRYCTPLDDTSKLTYLLKEYKSMLDNYAYYRDDIYDRELDDQELKDVRWFVTDLLSNIELKDKLNTTDRNLIIEIINESNRKILKK